MKSIKTIYKHLATLLKDGVQLDSQPVLKHVDLWYEQTEFPQLTEAIAYPAVFIQFQAQTIEDLGLHSQHVALLISVYLAQNHFYRTDMNNAANNPTLAYLDMLESIHVLLHGYEHSEVCGKLRRVSFEPVRTANNLIIYRQNFQLDYYEDAAISQTVTENLDAEPVFQPPAPIVPITKRFPDL